MKNKIIISAGIACLVHYISNSIAELIRGYSHQTLGGEELLALAVFVVVMYLLNRKKPSRAGTLKRLKTTSKVIIQP